MFGELSIESGDADPGFIGIKNSGGYVHIQQLTYLRIFEKVGNVFNPVNTGPQLAGLGKSKKYKICILHWEGSRISG